MYSFTKYGSAVSYDNNSVLSLCIHLYVCYRPAMQKFLAVSSNEAAYDGIRTSRP